MLNSSLSVLRDLEQDNGHSSDLDQRKSGTPFVKTVHKEDGTKLPTSPLSRGVLKRKGGTLSMQYCADSGTIETVFRTIISVNQLSLYGAVAEMCEECDSCHDRRSCTRRRSIAKI